MGYSLLTSQLLQCRGGWSKNIYPGAPLLHKFCFSKGLFSLTRQIFKPSILHGTKTMRILTHICNLLAINNIIFTYLHWDFWKWLSMPFHIQLGTQLISYSIPFLIPILSTRTKFSFSAQWSGKFMPNSFMMMIESITHSYAKWQAGPEAFHFQTTFI